MNSSDNKSKIAGIVITGLFFTSLIGIVYLHDSNASLEQLLNGNLLKTESVLSEKLQLEKEIIDFRKQMASYTGTNKDLDRKLKDATNKLAQREKQLKNAAQGSASAKELAELKKLKAELEREMASLQGNLMNTLNDRDKLSDELALANARNRELNNTVSIMEAMALNNYRIDATKRNDKHTVVARRTRNLNVAFDFPSDVADKVQFKVHTPDGKVIDKGDGALTYQIIDEPGEYSASLEVQNFAGGKSSKRIEMRYKPTERMKKGLYTIDIMNGQTYIASCQVYLK